MNKFAFPLICLISLSACDIQGYPKTGAEMRAYAQGSVFYKTSNYQVSRSASAVAQSWRTVARKCLNRTIRRTANVGTIGTSGIPMIETRVLNYTAVVKSDGKGGAELTLTTPVPKTLFNTIPAGTVNFAYSTHVSPARGGSARIEEAIPRGAGNQRFTNGIKAWSEGRSTVCPRLPG